MEKQISDTLNTVNAASSKLRHFIDREIVNVVYRERHPIYSSLAWVKDSSSI